MKEYKTPELLFDEISISSFLCASIGNLEMVIEVDEYINNGEEKLNLDSD